MQLTSGYPGRKGILPLPPYVQKTHLGLLFTFSDTFFVLYKKGPSQLIASREKSANMVGITVFIRPMYSTLSAIISLITLLIIIIVLRLFAERLKLPFHPFQGRRATPLRPLIQDYSWFTIGEGSDSWPFDYYTSACQLSLKPLAPI